jgi:hypothetical protein
MIGDDRPGRDSVGEGMDSGLELKNRMARV